MGFQSGLSGLNASSKNIDIIGNNVANANTVGFKSSRAVFADVYATSLAGAGSNNIGIGTKVASVQQEFTQGNISTTNNPLDLAISGRGFLRMDNNGSIAYSRNGQLHVDADGFIVNSDSLKVTGYPVDPFGNVVPTQPSPLQLSTADIAPNPTTSLRGTMNLDSRATGITVPFNTADTTTYTSSTASAVYDSLGNSHAMTLYFVKTAVPGAWNVHATLDSGPVTDVDLGNGPGLPVTLAFNNSGGLTTPMPLNNVSITMTNGAVTPLPMAIDLTGTTQFGSEFGVSSLAQDGYTSGRLTGFNISEDGTIKGLYSNGQANVKGQLVLANFANPNGLSPRGNNLWDETTASGIAVVGAPQTGNLGSIQSAAVEDSNVDLTQELVNMITAQRVYQANAQTIKTQDQTLQTLVNLR